MAKELGKFEKTYKQLSKQAEAVSQDAINRQKKLLKNQEGMTTEGLKHLADTVADAQSRGIVGTRMADYLKDGEVKGAHALVEKAIDEQFALVEALKDLEESAEPLIKQFRSLAAAIQKDLSKRRDSSASKKDIQAMLDTINADIKELERVPAICARQLGPVHLHPEQKYEAAVKKILAKTPAELGKEARKRLAPEKLRDRNRWKAFNTCKLEFKNVRSLCESALAKAEGGDLSGMNADLKLAVKARDAVTAIAKEFAGLQKEFKDFVEGSSEKGKIKAEIAQMAAMAKDVESRVRGTAATIKKAGVQGR